MIDYIGCVSKEDANVLRQICQYAERVLEFGSGASTQIFRAYCRGVVHSVETDPAWIAKTLGNLARLGLTGVDFCLYDEFAPAGPYGVIFVDGVDDLRLQFAIAAWSSLAVGGTMAFHDTRRTKPHGESTTSDVQNVCSVIARFSPEIESVVLNAMDSNTTLIRKRTPLLYQDWQKTEGRSDAQMGLT